MWCANEKSNFKKLKHNDCSLFGTGKFSEIYNIQFIHHHFVFTKMFSSRWFSRSNKLYSSPTFCIHAAVHLPHTKKFVIHAQLTPIYKWLPFIRIEHSRTLFYMKWTDFPLCVRPCKTVNWFWLLLSPVNIQFITLSHCERRKTAFHFTPSFFVTLCCGYIHIMHPCV